MSETTEGLDLNNPIHLAVANRLHDLEAALLAKDPMMPTHLAEIHKAMIAHEEIVHLLTDEEISKIMAAQQAHVNVSLVATTSGKSGSAKAAKKATGLGMADL